MSLAATAHALEEAIASVKISRLKVKLDIEKEGLKGDQITLQKTQVSTQIISEGLKQEQVKLADARVNTQILQVKGQKSIDRLQYENADKVLSRQEMAGKLQLKAINVSSIREDIRHQTVMVGGSKIPVAFGG